MFNVRFNLEIIGETYIYIYIYLYKQIYSYIGFCRIHTREGRTSLNTNVFNSDKNTHTVDTLK